MKVYSVLVFFMCLNVSTTFLMLSGAFPPPTSPTGYTTDFSSVFKIPQLDWQTIATLGTGGVVAFLSGALLGNVYAGMLVGLVWVFSLFLVPLGWIINSFPLFSYDIVMALCDHQDAYQPFAGAISGFLSGVFVFVGFMFVMELFSQRYMT